MGDRRTDYLEMGGEWGKGRRGRRGGRGDGRRGKGEMGGG